MSNIYVASSWRNIHQQSVVQLLREAGHTVYDFRKPRPNNNGFHWSEIDPDWQKWTPEQYVIGLNSNVASLGFYYDFSAMQEADTCVLVLPSGRSSHLEAGFFCGKDDKRLFVYMPEKVEPELMYLMANRICLTTEQLINEI